MRVAYAICFTVLFWTSCSFNTRGTKALNPGELLLDSILGQKLEIVKRNAFLHTKYRLTDTVLEDEGVEWKALAVHDKVNNALLALLEANWQDSMHISRITIVDSSISIGAFYVGATFKDIKAIVDTSKLNNSPDGELSFTCVNDSRIHFLMELPDSSPLAMGVGSLAEIPDELLVNGIVLQE
ncbi:hypothetical protein SAMN05444266_10573 [Chitinophaga jiangningensis]|uniref:Uncharacterized protein n=1 Tax=Chitinophaga jiangningensis TaxID=1419482 RepID=A0A1M7DPC7_9BACT|nr:hypothetical protein [Chitinophaga jiangningensis]SHL81233.1 hypothetical protein SAMN05444266_10573 [Chitinophaga jiangningensis]